MLSFASLETPLADQFRLASMHSTERMSQPYAYAATALSPRADLAFNELLGRHATIGGDHVETVKMAKAETVFLGRVWPHRPVWGAR